MITMRKQRYRQIDSFMGKLSKYSPLEDLVIQEMVSQKKKKKKVLSHPASLNGILDVKIEQSSQSSQSLDLWL